MLFGNLVDLKSQKLTSLLREEIQIEVGQFSTSSSELSSTWNLFTLKSVHCEMNNLMITLNRFHVELNSLLQTENWPTYVCIFSCKKACQFLWIEIY